ncbi:MAG TPA: UDP-N-acetylglucosamine--N-acetylmuramyl-(pentapeptide) pyrophosphoryl-undecaprenol N-acetylglucosamine transferase [Candidatus Paceibacterota bacterium]|nr:UDP-N-acetylglucosamine--N-acetylmuramyl-(pentapeptide) pyrophosphoryl-undecaprenol N-acetylglucosamine transferase [Candidatus Paceibacterota bacterium]
MKILFTGGGTGGHFYPIIAVAQAIREHAKEKKVLPPQFYFMAPAKYNPRALFDNEIEFIYVPAGKIRRYFSLLNITDAFKTLYGCCIALIKMFSVYPDVIFSKGGYTSFPPLLAARILGIPVVIHDSDSHPGRANLWAGKFAKRIALSYPSAATFFKVKDPTKIAYTGNPIRAEIAQPLKNGAFEFLNLEQGVPVVLVLGGSQGSQNINDVIIQALPELLNKYQIIHQTGRANLEEIQSTTSITLKDHPYKYRYHPFDYLDELALRMSTGAATVIVSRAGSTIFEIAAWGVPSIIIPLPSSVSHDQTANAFAYASTGAASVIEENNLTPHILVEEINRIVGSAAISKTMSERAKAFSRLDSASLIAQAILNIALEHEN